MTDLTTGILAIACSAIVGLLIFGAAAISLRPRREQPEPTQPQPIVEVEGNPPVASIYYYDPSQPSGKHEVLIDVSRNKNGVMWDNLRNKPHDPNDNG